MNNETIFALIFLGIAIVSVVAWIFLFADSKSWPSVEGTVVSSNITKVESTESITGSNKKQTVTRYQLNLEYNYTVNGIKFVGTHLFPEFKFVKLIEQSVGGSINEFDSIENAQEMQTKYSAGTITKVYYNSKDASQSCLINSSFMTLKAYILMIVLLAIVISAIAFVLIKFF